MTKLELLQKYYGAACHNLLCYSRNFAMNEAKDGYEVEWKQSLKECDLLKEMMVECEATQKEAATLQAAKDMIEKFRKDLQLLKSSDIFIEIYPLILKRINQGSTVANESPAYGATREEIKKALEVLKQKRD